MQLDVKGGGKVLEKLSPFPVLSIVLVLDPFFFLVAKVMPIFNRSILNLRARPKGRAFPLLDSLYKFEFDDLTMNMNMSQCST